MALKKVLLILVTICLTQIINCVFGELFLLGVFQLIEIQLADDLGNGGKERSAGAIASSLKLISNLSIYGRPLLKTVFGASLTIYFAALLAAFWLLRFQKKLGQLGKYVQNPRFYWYLLATVVVNLLLAALLVFLDLRQKRADDELLRVYDEFKLDLSRILQETSQSPKQKQLTVNSGAVVVLNEHSLFDVRHSIATLKSFIYIGYFNAYLTILSLAICSTLTVVFVLLDFVC